MVVVVGAVVVVDELSEVSDDEEPCVGWVTTSSNTPVARRAVSIAVVVVSAGTEPAGVDGEVVVCSS